MKNKKKTATKKKTLLHIPDVNMGLQDGIFLAEKTLAAPVPLQELTTELLKRIPVARKTGTQRLAETLTHSSVLGYDKKTETLVPAACLFEKFSF